MRRENVFNNNFDSNQKIIQKDLEYYTLPAIKSLLKSYMKEIEFLDQDKSELRNGEIFRIDKLKYISTYFQDCDNLSEENNKRIQMKVINEAKKLKCSVLGIYPIISSNSDIIDDYIFVTWDYNLLKNVNNGKNTAIKIRLNDLYKKAYNNTNNDLKIYKRTLKYADGAQYFSSDEFFNLINYNKQLENDIATVTRKVEKKEITSEEAQIILESRVRNSKTQKYFRKKLIIDRKCHCQLCGIDKENLLVASHIYPVKSIFKNYINNSKRLEMISNISNGLLLCPTHDKIFDSGYISFTDTGKILISKQISDMTELLQINENTYIDKNKFNEKFMNYHRKNIFKVN